MKIYLACPFFNIDEILKYEAAIEGLRGRGYEVYVPREHTIDGAWEMSNQTWASYVFADDVEAIDDCEVVVVMNFGMYSDSGTAWECGAAFALGKKVVNILCGCDDTEYSLMMVNGTNTTVDLATFRKEWFANILENIDKEANEKISQK